MPRRGKTAFKERHSLRHALSQEATIPAHKRVSTARSATDPVKKVKHKKSRSEVGRVKLDVFIPSTVSVGNLARLLKVKLATLQRKMREAGMGEDASYDHVLTSDYAVLLAEEFNRNPVINDEAAFDIYPSPLNPDPSSLPSRPPIVTIMGHVDHGKTTLLDTLRSASVAAGEAGGITQHIGAFSVPVPSSAGGDGSSSITFLDTPGHAAFSAMRARGASVTDIIVLVVAADDGVMPQTKEVIDLVKQDEGKVQLVVAINKVDKPGINVENIYNALLVEGVHLEAIGGDIPSVEVSGLTGQGLDRLVETISAVAEMQDLHAERDGNVHGHVLESKIQKGFGPVATVLVSRGCLKTGSFIISGTKYAKVRAMSDAAGKTVKSAYPGMAVTVSGWKELPDAGDEVLQGIEQDVKKAVANRERKAEQDATLVDIEAINNARRLERERRELEAEAVAANKEIPAEVMNPDGPKELRLVIKGDVSGSVEALAGALEGIGNDKAKVKIVATGVGEVTESDVLMAKAAGGMIIAFAIPVPKSATIAASSNNIPVYKSAIIYQVMDEVTKRVIGLLPAKWDKRILGEATVLQLFEIQLSGKRTKKVAGSRITNGVVEKSKDVQVVRNGQVVHEGRLDTFRHLKKDITEASKGLECGISIENFDDLREGDMIQAFSNVERTKTL
ncbi:initiation factor 2 [Dentipellis sp. KUC8613]|nr:initiation factor 2 [Dentipellis sp. KUC8613]